MRRYLCYVAIFGAILFVSVMIGTGMVPMDSLGHTNMGYGFFVGLMSLLCVYPVLLGIQALVVLFVRAVLRGHPAKNTIWQFALTLALCVVGLVDGFRADPAEQSFKYLAEEMPQSVQDYKWACYTSFCDRLWLMSFRIDPADFDKIIQKYEYTLEENPDDLQLSLLWECDSNDKEQPMVYPPEPMVFHYHYQGQPDGDGSLSISIYANQKKDLVYASVSCQ